MPIYNQRSSFLPLLHMWLPFIQFALFHPPSPLVTNIMLSESMSLFLICFVSSLFLFCFIVHIGVKSYHRPSYCRDFAQNVLYLEYSSLLSLSSYLPLILQLLLSSSSFSRKPPLTSQIRSAPWKALSAPYLYGYLIICLPHWTEQGCLCSSLYLCSWYREGTQHMFVNPSVRHSFQCLGQNKRVSEVPVAL